MPPPHCSTQGCWTGTAACNSATRPWERGEGGRFAELAPGVRLTQQDIRSVQPAKAAIRSDVGMHSEPGHAGWSPDAVRAIGDILDSHRAHVALAYSLGVPIVCGSDAGSPGVEHGRGLIDEMTSMLELGIDMRSVLASATSRPRRQWSAASNAVVAGARPDLLVLAESPFRDRSALRRPLAVGSFADVSADLAKARAAYPSPHERNFAAY